MIITCPSCDTRYEVNPSALTPSGRTVRCAKCGNSWTEQAPQDSPRPVAPQAPEPAPASKPAPAPAPAPKEITFEVTPAAPDDDFDVAASPPAPDDDDDDDFDVPDLDDIAMPEMRSRSAKPKRAAKTRGGRLGALGGGQRIGLIVGWVVLMLAIVGVLAGGLFGRDMIIAAWPPAAKLYDTLGLGEPEPEFGLDLRNIQSSQKREGGKVILNITGIITNISEGPQRVPKLRGALLDTKRNPIHDWIFAAPKSTLEPGEKMDFSTSVTDPPARARGLAVTFMERAPMERVPEKDGEMVGSGSKEAGEEAKKK